jgi:hypothetical protein
MGMVYTTLDYQSAGRHYAVDFYEQVVTVAGNECIPSASSVRSEQQPRRQQAGSTPQQVGIVHTALGPAVAGAVLDHFVGCIIHGRTPRHQLQGVV